MELANQIEDKQMHLLQIRRRQEKEHRARILLSEAREALTRTSTENAIKAQDKNLFNYLIAALEEYRLQLYKCGHEELGLGATVDSFLYSLN